MEHKEESGLSVILVLIATLLSHASLVYEPTKNITKMAIVVSLFAHFVIPLIRKHFKIMISEITNFDCFLLAAALLYEAITLTTIYSYPMSSNTFMAVALWGFISILRSVRG